MQPIMIKLSTSEMSSFSMNRYAYEDKFPGIWHFHNEYELTLILKGKGIRLVGNHIDRFEEGDLVFIGKGLPHTWRSDDPDKSRVSGGSDALVIHFFEDFLGDGFFKAPELAQVCQLMQKAKRGLKITGDTQQHVISQLQMMELLNGLEKLIMFLNILKTLSTSRDFVELSSEGFLASSDSVDTERLNRVYGYIMKNFRNEISLGEVAGVACMSPNAFSRYFALHSRKSFSEFLIQLRIGYACKRLMRDDVTVGQACYESGFKNLSNFNLQFKKITKYSPKQYQLKYKQLYG